MSIKKSAPTFTPSNPKPNLEKTISLMLSVPSPEFQDVFGHLFVMIIPLSMIAFIFVHIASRCAELVVLTRGDASCEPGTGAYLSGAAFLLITVYAG